MCVKFDLGIYIYANELSKPCTMRSSHNHHFDCSDTTTLCLCVSNHRPWGPFLKWKMGSLTCAKSFVQVHEDETGTGKSSHALTRKNWRKKSLHPVSTGGRGHGITFTGLPTSQELTTKLQSLTVTLWKFPFDDRVCIMVCFVLYNCVWTDLVDLTRAVS